MKKSFTAKAVAVALGFASASVMAGYDGTATPTVTDRFASELSYSTTASAIAQTGTGTTVGSTSIKVALGWGLAANASNFIRVDVTNATFNTSAPSGAFATCGGTVTTSQIGTDYVIFQVTGQGTTCSPTEALTLHLPGVVVGSNSSAVGFSYKQFATSSDAIANGTPLPGSVSANLLTFAAGLAAPTYSDSFARACFSTSSSSGCGAATGSWKDFGAGAVSAPIGTITLGTTSGVKKASGAAVTLADLTGATSSIVFSGDFNNATSVALAAGSNSCAGAATTATLNTGTNKTTATVTGAALTTAGSFTLCFLPNVAATSGIAAQTITADYNPVAATGASGLVDPASSTVGTIRRDGLELLAPFVTINPNFRSNITLYNDNTSAVTWTATNIPQGGSCAAGTLTGSIPARGMVTIAATDICPSISGSSNNNRLAMRFAFGTSGNIRGTVTTANTGATTSATVNMVNPATTAH